MDKEKLLNQFKQKNAKLFEHSQKIIVTELVEDWNPETNEVIVHNPPIYQIEVWRPFIFDVRLIPTEFNGIKVVDHFFGSYPSEFPSVHAAIPLEEFQAPERYIKFVDNNLGLISNKIRIPSLTRDDALDALTGDFEKHIKWCNEMRISRINDESENIIFFNKLLYEVRQAYHLSDVYLKNKDKKWYYAITATKFSRNKPLIIGFNWGVDNKWIEKGNKYTPQCDYPLSNFSGLYDDLGSFKRTIKLFHQYFPSALSGTQMNYCFFRSERENQITQRDLELCKPIFEKIVNYLNPSCIISFTMKTHFLTSKDSKIKTIEISNGKSTLFVSKGKVMINKRLIDFYNLPHPNYPVNSEARTKAWEECFK